MNFKDMSFYVYSNATRKVATYNYLKRINANVVLINGSGESLDVDDPSELLIPDKSVLDAHRNIVRLAEQRGEENVWIAEDGLAKLLVQDPETFLWKKVADLTDEVIHSALEEEYEKFAESELNYMSLCLRVGIKRDSVGGIEFKEDKVKKLGTTFTLWNVTSLRMMINFIDKRSGGKEYSHGLDIILASAAACLGFQNAVDFRIGADEQASSTLRTTGNAALLRAQDIKNITELFPEVKLHFSWSKAQPHTATYEGESQVEANIAEYKRNIGLIKNYEYQRECIEAFSETFYNYFEEKYGNS